jgi:hypothetical protein
MGSFSYLLGIKNPIYPSTSLACGTSFRTVSKAFQETKLTTRTTEKGGPQCNFQIQGPDKAGQFQLATPNNSPTKTPSTNGTYASSVTKNLYKAPANPLTAMVAKDGFMFRRVSPGAVCLRLINYSNSQQTMEVALEVIFDSFSLLQSVTTIRLARTEMVFDPKAAPKMCKQETES